MAWKPSELDTAMRMFVIGREARLRREIRELEAAGYRAVEVPGAIHLGRGIWMYPLEVTRVRSEPSMAVPAGSDKKKARLVLRETARTEHDPLQTW